MRLEEVVDHRDDLLGRQRRGGVWVEEGRLVDEVTRALPTATTVSSTVFRNVRLSARHCGGMLPIGCGTAPSPVTRIGIDAGVGREPLDQTVVADVAVGSICVSVSGRTRTARPARRCARARSRLPGPAGPSGRPTSRGSPRSAGCTRRSRSGSARPGPDGAGTTARTRTSARSSRWGSTRPLEDLPHADTPAEALGVGLRDLAEARVQVLPGLAVAEHVDEALVVEPAVRNSTRSSGTPTMCARTRVCLGRCDTPIVCDAGQDDPLQMPHGTMAIGFV